MSALALALSACLGWHYLIGGSVIGCGGGSTCDQVLDSRWSAIGGVLPVSGLAAGAYLAMLVSSLSLGSATAAPVRRLAWSALLILAGAATGSAVWFTIVQKWIIGAFCPYCMTTHITGLLLAVLVMRRAPSRFDDDSSPVAPAASAVLRRLPCFLVGLALAGLLAAGQIAAAPAGAHRDGESLANQPALDPHAVPLVGSPDARYVVTLLFDYKCPHCQQLHLMLDGAIRLYRGKLAFALCPAPLNTKCNPYVPRDVDAFKDSCDLARIALAVWVARREAFPGFDRWMYSFESGDRWHPRSLDAARAKAVAMVGEANFDAALADPWIDRYLHTSIRIYGETMQGGTGGVPKLAFGSRWLSPEPNNAADLASMLQESLGVPKP